MKINVKENWPLYLVLIGILAVVFNDLIKAWNRPELPTMNKSMQSDDWQAPSLFLDNILEGNAREQVIYGQDIISNTAKYFGPNGTVKAISNGMNCQNCHLDAGTKIWGNNYSAVASTYPKYRDRSGTVETIPVRVNDCFERSLNGSSIDTNSTEMKAIIAYLQWIGQNIIKGVSPAGSGIKPLPYLKRAADPIKGQFVYADNCKTCHGVDGEGLLLLYGQGYTYPPLWGEHSYNTGAGLFRLSRLAGYIKTNMPFNQGEPGVRILTDEEAWDVAAFINTRPRPGKDITKDWPDISKKPIDHPFGPYADGFSEQQHKLGPFEPILAAKKGTIKK